MKKILNTLCCLLAALAVVGCSIDDMETTGAIHGYACDKEGTPLVGSTVELVGTGRKAVVDAEGRFYFFHVPAGLAQLQLTQADGTQINENVQVPIENVMTVALQEWHKDFPFVLEYASDFTSTGDRKGLNLDVRLTNASNVPQTCSVYGEGELSISQVSPPYFVPNGISAGDEMTLDPGKYARITVSQTLESLTGFNKMYISWNGKRQVVVFHTTHT